MVEAKDAWWLAIMVPALTGLTIAAYRVPDGYRRLAHILYVAVSLAFFAALLWDSAIQAALLAAATATGPDTRSQIRDAIGSLQVVNNHLFLGYFALLAYLLFLECFPLLGVVEQPHRADKKKERQQKSAPKDT